MSTSEQSAACTRYDRARAGSTVYREGVVSRKPLQRNRVSDEKRRQVLELSETHSITEIARALGLRKGTVTGIRGRARAEGWTPKRTANARHVVSRRDGKMKCPACGGDALVLDVRASGEAIRRRRECDRCHARFTTYEVQGAERQGRKSGEITNRITKIIEELSLLAEPLVKIERAAVVGFDEEETTNG